MKVLKEYARLPLFAIGVFLYVSTLQIFAISSSTDSDLYFLINGGWKVLEQQHVPHMLFNTIHNGFHTIMQQWLMCVIDAVAYNTAGYLGVKLVAVTGYIIVMLLLFLYIYENINNKSYRILALAIVSLPIGYYMNGRPWEASICILCAFVYCSDKYIRSKKALWLMSWPILSILLSNMHAAVWGLLLCLGLTYVFPGLMVFKTVTTIKRELLPDLKEKRMLWLFYILMIPAACINPNGIENVLYIFKAYGTTSTKARLTIAEMAKPEILSISGIVVLIAILFFLYYIRLKWEACDWQKVYMVLGCTALGIMHYRNLWLCSLGIMPIMCTVFNEWGESEEIHPESGSKIVRHLSGVSELLVNNCIAFVAAVIIMVSAISINIFIINDGQHDQDTLNSPICAADYLDGVNKEEIVLFTEFDNGAYMAFRGYDVYFHAQPELYGVDINGKKDIYEEYQSLIIEPDFDYESFIEAYGFNYLCIAKNENMYQHVKDNEGYEIVVDTDDYVLAKRL